LKIKTLCAIIAASFAITACGSSGGNNNATTSSSSSGNNDDIKIVVADVQKVLNTNADIALAVYSDAVDTALLLQAALATFQTEPTQANLDAAKKAWLVAREPYGQTEVYRFRKSPIDSTNYQDENGPEGDINAWPLGEGLIDYVTTGSDFGDDQVGVTLHTTGVDYPSKTIINSTDIAINAALISNTATAPDEHDVIAGYHAIEFLLWGQDLNLDGNADTEDSREMSTGSDILNSGGHRPLEDFTTNDFADRRHTYLEVVAQKLVDDLTSVRDGWADGAAYRNAFTSISDAATAKRKLAEILIGMGTLSEGELAGERIQIAFRGNSQEDEHSCFSDNTHRDIWLNAEGVSNSYYGDYAGYDSDLDGIDDVTRRAVVGYGLDDYLESVALTQLATRMEAALDATWDNVRAVDASARAGSPVDVLIMDNNNRDNVLAQTILSLSAQASVIAQVAVALAIDETVVDPDASACDTSNPSADCKE
jgi:putative iron-regulated protein